MTTPRRHLILMVIALIAIGCGKNTSPDGGGGGGGGGGTAGIAVPKEISAVPAKSASTSTSALIGRLQQALAPDSDYATAQTVKFVDERALSQFDIFNTIFKALEQTHYADAENVGAGPYGAMVAWVEERGDGQNSKRLVPWVVDSSMAVEDGKDVNVVHVWMQDMMEAGPEGISPTIKVELKIYEPPMQRADGSYSDYGIWTINADFGGPKGPPPPPGAPGPGPGGEGQSFFTAAAARSADGLSVIMLHEKEGPDREKRGIMQRADDRGFGKVTFPDFSQCHEPECQPQLVTVAYVYNDEHVALKKGAEPVIYKDRLDVVDLVHRYGLYDAETGADVAKSRSFGFPLRYADGQGLQRHGYYGAWQGRHQIWSDGQQGIPEGTTVFRADRPPGQQTESYTVSKAYRGTLVKRTMVPAAIDDIRNLVVETWVHQNMSLRWTEEGWYNCINPNYQTWPPTCGEGSGPFTDWASLVVNPNDRRRDININFWDQQQNQPVNLIWDAAGPSGPGLYKVIWNTPPTPPTPTGEIWWSPTEGFEGGEPEPAPQLWVNVNGSVYISYNGSSWVQKTVQSFDEQTWMPTFEPDGDLPYSLEQGREYYINNPGANYVVKRTGDAAYDVQIELQSVANPLNAGTFVPAGAIFKEQWGGEGQSTYRFETSSTSPNYMKLVYATKADNDNSPGAAVGAVVQQGRWGLVAWVNGASTGMQYNWDYPQDGQDWGQQQYLVAGDGSFKMLDDPIRLKPVTLQSHAGESKTYGLQFDGSWVGGLPDIFRELQKNDWVVSEDIADKIVVIPAGTEVEDAADSSKRYLFKPLQMNEYLAVIPEAPELDLGQATALNLQLVPAFSPNGLGDLPDVSVKYSEGKLVE